MTTVRVLVGQKVLAPSDSARAMDSHCLCWDYTDVPDGVQSVPALLTCQLPRIRQELVQWVYDLGRLKVRGQEVQEHLKAGAALSMWWCSLLFEKHPRVTPKLYSALKARALELYVEKHKATHLVLEGHDPTLQKVLQEFCAHTGRIFTHVPAPTGGGADCANSSANSSATAAKRPSLKARVRALGVRCYHALPAPCKAVGRFALWLWRVRRHLPRTASPSPGPHGDHASTGATIATYFPNIDPTLAKEGRFRSRYWENLHDALNNPQNRSQSSVQTNAQDKSNTQGQALPVHWLFVLFPSPQYSFAQCLALRDSFAARTAAQIAQASTDSPNSAGISTAQHTDVDGASFHFMEEFLHTKDIFSACLRYMRLCASSLRLQAHVREHCQLPTSRMPLWSYMGEYFADSFRGWRCLERCLHHKALGRYVEWVGPQDWTIFPLENCPWERMLTHAVHSAGHGPVYGTQHSTLRPTDFRYFDDARTFSDPDCMVFQPDMVCGNGQGACDQLRIAKLPPERMGMIEALRYMYLYRAQGPCPPQPVQGKLLIVTSFFADEVADHMRVLAAALHAGLLTDWQVTIKAHPYLAVDDYMRALFPAEYLGNAKHAIHLSTAPINELLTSGTLVWASNSTTVALEAAMQGLPVMVQLPANDVDLCPLQDMKGVARIATVAHVAAALAAPSHARIPNDYLALNPDLPRWRDLLGL